MRWPWEQARLRIEPWRVPCEAEETVLREILRERAIAGDPQEVAEDGWPMLFVGLGEGRWLASSGARPMRVRRSARAGKAPRADQRTNRAGVTKHRALSRALDWAVLSGRPVTVAGQEPRNQLP